MIVRLTVCVLTCLIGQLLFSQQNTLIEQVNESLKEYRELFPSEKVYVHTDRKYYSPGDVVWYQAYLADGVNHQPSQISKAIVVDLYNQNNELVAQNKVYSDGGFGNGQIDLPKKLKAGSYILKGYTNWMKNFDEAFMFEKELVVIDSIWSFGQTEDISLDLQFFPEGGHLVAGIKSKIAFKAINAIGYGAVVSGKIVDNENNEVADFQTEHNGMGVFLFTPQPNKTYKAILNGYGFAFPFPRTEEEGMVLEVDNKNKNILKLIIRSSEKFLNSQDFSLIIHSRGQTIYALHPQLTKAENVISLPKMHFPDGIAHISLLDQNANVVFDRLVFVDKPKGNIKLNLDSSNYKPRGAIKARLNVSGPGGAPINGIFSMSVIDLSQTLDRQPQQTIYSDLLLNSDLKGFVENPMYYFNEDNPKAQAHLDLLMLTHGWSKFSWEEILNKGYDAPEYHAEKGLTLTGRLMKDGGKKPEPEGKVTFLNQKILPPVMKEAKSDENGFFQLNGLEYYNGDEVIFQGNDRKGGQYVELLLDTAKAYQALIGPFESMTETVTINREAVADYAEQNAVRNKINLQYDFDSTRYRDLGSVVVHGKREQQKQGNLKNIYGQSDYTVPFSQLRTEAHHNPFQVLQGRIPGVKIEIGGTDVKISIRNTIGKNSSGAELEELMPLILLDDHPMRYEELTTLPSIMIDRVEVYKGVSTSAFGTQGGAGVIAFYTKTGADIIKSLSSHQGAVFPTVLKNGFSKPREFYEPKYNVQLPEHAKPDRRLLLSWQPMIMVENSEEVPLEFWNSDEITEVLIDIQGLSTAGEPFHFSTIYKITKD